MTSNAITSYSIEPVAALPIDPHLVEALLNSMAEYSAQLHGRRVWLACSGGRDSLALAALCVQLYQQGRLPFLPQLLHVDHGLQVDSRQWAAHVAMWAQVQNIPCQILQTQVNGHDEQAARQARYDAMRKQMNQDDVLLLAHHADDQAETILMRLIQGAGVNGLSGMQPWRTQTKGAHRIVLWRPWLTIQRASISAYAKRLQLPYIDDPTNELGDNVRSGLRRDIMPVLAKYNPNVINNMARSAQLLSDAEATIQAQAAKDMRRVAIHSLQLAPAQRALDIDELNALPEYRKRQLLHHWLGQDEPLPPAKQLIDDVLRLSQRRDHDHQTALFWQGRKQSYTIRRYRQQLYRLSEQWSAWLETPLSNQTQILFDPMMANIYPDNTKTVPITLRASEEFIWQLRIKSQVLAQLLNVDEGNKAFQTVIKIAPLGRKQSLKTKLSTHSQSGKKLFQTLGIPSWLRESLVVVSAALIDKDVETSDTQSLQMNPVLLLSPFDTWILCSDKSTNQSTDISLTEWIENNLQTSHKP